ncbi:MAG: hypothetical protein SFU25_05660 [Candidatus Caenarcaniphilales bacterium]|nr:hypothetical protein [Candidatus Caenarcaniphilales bacterium]
MKISSINPHTKIILKSSKHEFKPLPSQIQEYLRTSGLQGYLCRLDPTSSTYNSRSIIESDGKYIVVRDNLPELWRPAYDACMNERSERSLTVESRARPSSWASYEQSISIQSDAIDAGISKGFVPKLRGLLQFLERYNAQSTVQSN